MHEQVRVLQIACNIAESAATRKARRQGRCLRSELQQGSPALSLLAFSRGRCRACTRQHANEHKILPAAPSCPIHMRACVHPSQPGFGWLYWLEGGGGSEISSAQPIAAARRGLSLFSWLSFRWMSCDVLVPCMRVLLSWGGRPEEKRF